MMSIVGLWLAYDKMSTAIWVSVVIRVQRVIWSCENRFETSCFRELPSKQVMSQSSNAVAGNQTGMCDSDRQVL